MWSVFVTFATAGFLIFYGFGVTGWPIDVTRGVGFLEKRSPNTRRMLGLVLIGVGTTVMAFQIADLVRNGT